MTTYVKGLSACQVKAEECLPETVGNPNFKGANPTLGHTRRRGLPPAETFSTADF